MSALTDESPRLPHGTDKTQTRCTALGPSHCIERGRVSPRTLNWKVLAQSHNLEGSAGVHKPVGGNVHATHVAKRNAGVPDFRPKPVPREGRCASLGEHQQTSRYASPAGTTSFVMSANDVTAGPSFMRLLIGMKMHGSSSCVNREQTVDVLQTNTKVPSAAGPTASMKPPNDVTDVPVFAERRQSRKHAPAGTRSNFPGAAGPALCVNPSNDVTDVPVFTETHQSRKTAKRRRNSCLTLVPDLFLETIAVRQTRCPLRQEAIGAKVIHNFVRQ